MKRAPLPGAGDQVARLLTLVPYLHHRDSVRLGDAAGLMGVTPEQVLDDLRVLFMCGLPGGLPDDLIDVDLDAIQSVEGAPLADGVIRVGNAEYLARPLRLSPTEASALVVALHTLRSGSSDDVQAIVDGLLHKLEGSLLEAATPPERARIAVATGPGEAALVARTAQLQRAADERRQVLLKYHVPARDEISERLVDPYGVVTSGRFSYLDAWCHKADADRLFRLDRITDVAVQATPLATNPRPPRDISEGAFDAHAGSGVLATLLLQPEARWACDYYPMRAVRPKAGGSAEVDLIVADPRWLNRLLLRLAPHATVLGPEEFVSGYTAAAQATLARYQGSGA